MTFTIQNDFEDCKKQTANIVIVGTRLFTKVPCKQLAISNIFCTDTTSTVL